MIPVHPFFYVIQFSVIPLRPSGITENCIHLENKLQLVAAWTVADVTEQI